jgi:hypothetical protein
MPLLIKPPATPFQSANHFTASVTSLAIFLALKGKFYSFFVPFVALTHK